MPESTRQPRKPPGSLTGRPAAPGQGSWELDLLNGTAWYSDWFYQRFKWPHEVKRKRLDDLRPFLPCGAWEALLLAIRGHLEWQRPLDAEVRVQLPGNRVEWWRMQGALECNSRGKPMFLAGSMRDITEERQQGSPAETPPSADPKP